MKCGVKIGASQKMSWLTVRHKIKYLEILLNYVLFIQNKISTSVKNHNHDDNDNDECTKLVFKRLMNDHLH